MVDYGLPAKPGWVCPNDRQLALRAKLKTGWSVKTQTLGTYGGQQKAAAPLNEVEQQTIKAVIKRAEQLEVKEQERVGKLVDRLENMRRNAMGNGTNQCILCGDRFGMLGAPSLLCHDCKKSVCSKCGIDTVSSQREPISLCKICSETREMWKKSGAWFYKGLPRYTLPEKKVVDSAGKYAGRRAQPRLGIEKNTWSKAGIGAVAASKIADEEESSSDDELVRRSRQTRIKPFDETDVATTTPPVGADRVVERVNTRQGSCVTFDLSSVGGASSGHSQRAETLSLHSDGDASLGEASQYNDVDRAGLRDYYRREELAASTASFAESVQLPYPSRMSSGSQSNSEPNSWEIVERDPELNHSLARTTLHGRRDSQVSTLSRDWYGSEDRLSLSGSSVSGHRTLPDTSEDVVSPRPHDTPQLGTLELSLLYDPMSMSLHCSLHRAKGLKPMDINGLSDPFCRLNVLPTEGKSNRLRTKTVHKSRNPEFNETLTFYGISERDIGRKVLHILVLDDDKYGHDFIGEARITLARLRPEISRYMNVYLEPRFPVADDDEVWGSDEWTRGQILVTLCYSTRKRALLVGISRCVNLAPMDNNGLSDPFVKLRLKPDSHHRKYKTSVKWKNLNPTFNEEFAFETKMTDLPKQALEITVWDKDYGKSNDYLGGLQLGWYSKGDRLRHWVDMIKFPDHKHEGWHNLGEELLSE